MVKGVLNEAIHSDYLFLAKLSELLRLYYKVKIGFTIKLVVV